MPLDDYVKPNDVTIVDIVIRSKLGGPRPAEFSLFHSALFDQVHIYEDLFAPCLKGELFILDGANFIGHFPIIGQEEIEITFKTPAVTDKYIKHTFDVYKTSPRLNNQEGPQYEGYTLYFASPELLHDSHIKCSKSFNGTPSAIVSTIMKEYFPSSLINIEDSRNFMRFIPPYWSPFKCINWLSRRTMTLEESKREANFVLFQNLSTDNGVFNYVSLSTLAQGESLEDYIVSVGDRQDIGSGKNLAMTIPDVIEYSNEKYVDKLENVQTGMLASTLLTHDITFKKFDTTTYSYNLDFNNANHLDEYPLMPPRNDVLSTHSDSMIHFKPKQNHLYIIRDSEGNIISEPEEDNFFQEDWLLHRKSLMEQMSLQKHKIRVAGDTRRKVGDVVTLSIPTSEIHDDRIESAIDTNISGRFLVTSIKHIINRVGPTHEMVLELSRDSLSKPIPDESTFIT